MTDVAERTVVETMSRNKNQVNLTYNLFKKDKKKEKVFEFYGVWRVFEFEEIVKILDENGFKIFGIHRSFEDTKGDILNMKMPKSSTNQLILTCSKFKKIEVLL